MIPTWRLVLAFSWLTSANLLDNHTLVLCIGGLYDIHDPGLTDYGSCSRTLSAAQTILSEVHQYSVAWVNENLLQNFTDPPLQLDTVLVDTCSSVVIGTQQSVLLFASSNRSICPGAQTPYDRNQLYATVGAVISDNAKVATNILRAFRIPFVSSFATSTDFDDQVLYPYFLRTIPSDKYQAQATLALLQEFEWTVVNLIYETSAYGQGLRDAFYAWNGDRVCINAEIRLVPDQPIGTIDWNRTLNVLRNSQKSGVSVTVVYLNRVLAIQYFDKVVDSDLNGKLFHVGVDGWGTMLPLTSDMEPAIRNAIITECTDPDQNTQLHPAVAAVANVTIDEAKLGTKYGRNAYFASLIAQQNNCNVSNCDDCDAGDSAEQCIGNETLNTKDFPDGAARYAKLVFETIYIVADAIRQVAMTYGPYAFHNLTNISEVLFEHMSHESYSVHNMSAFHFFNATNSAPPVYHFYQVQNAIWEPVGNFTVQTDGNSTLVISPGLASQRWTVLNFTNTNLKACLPTCNDTSTPMFSALQGNVNFCGRSCCYKCRECADASYAIVNGSGCVTCVNGQIPNRTNASCVNAGFEYNFSPLQVFLMGISVLGVMVSVIVIIIFMKYMGTPVIKATGEQLNLIVAASPFMQFSAVLLAILHPTTASCASTWALLSVGISACISVIMLRLHVFRIACFAVPDGSASLPIVNNDFVRNCIKSSHMRVQLCMGGMVVQLVIVVVWIILRPPEVVLQQYTDERVGYMAVCTSHYEPQSAVLLVAPACMLLMAINLAYRLLSVTLHFFLRQIHLTLGMCFCYLCLGIVVPLILFFHDTSDLRVKVVIFQVWAFLLGFVTLVCLLLPQMYLVLLKPEKNSSGYVSRRSIKHDHTGVLTYMPNTN